MTFTETVTLVTINCGSCGGTFAINQAFRDAKQREGGGWRCPYCGNERGYYANSEINVLRRQVAQSQAAKDQAEAEARDANNRARDANNRAKAAEQKATAAAGETKRLKVRAAAGVCPCCHRQFQNMKRHMATKHPKLAEAGQ